MLGILAASALTVGAMAGSISAAALPSDRNCYALLVSAFAPGNPVPDNAIGKGIKDEFAESGSGSLGLARIGLPCG